MRPVGSAEELLHHRKRAIELLRQGLSKSEVARWIGVARRSVQRWYKSWQRGGRKALLPKPATGTPSKLTKRQKARLEVMIHKGAIAAGFDSDIWTGRRVVAVIHKHFGVVYHRHSVPRLLRELGLSRQKPQRVAREQNPKLKARWLAQKLPAIKKNGVASRRLDRLY